MKVSPDTNVLARAVLRDDWKQAALADELLREASALHISLITLCELVWIAQKGYKLPARDVAEAIQRLLDAGNVVVNRTAVQAGLSAMLAGADFADGVMAYEGRWSGADTFASFDQKAVAVLTTQGYSATLVE